MEAIILAGGLGTRLQKVLPHLPKVLAPIQNIPFLTFLLTQLEKSGVFSKIILSLGFRSDQIIKYLESYSSSLPIVSIVEPNQLGTGGAILHVLPQVNSSTFCVLNGDSYSDLCFRDFYQFHRDHNAEISIASYETEDTRRYGTLQYDCNLRVIKFMEKIEEKKRGTINRGIYFCEKQIFADFPKKEYSLEKDFFPKFLKRRMFAYSQQAVFIDIGIQEAYIEAQQLVK